jgi:tetratricopeptide (TPR) repeat protein
VGDTASLLLLDAVLAEAGRTEDALHVLERAATGPVVWDRISWRLTDLGRQDEASHATDQARQARTEPLGDAEQARRTADAALALSRLGRNRKAITTFEQATEMYRRLWPDERAGLAATLMNFAGTLTASGWLTFAAHLLRDAVEVLKPLAETNLNWRVARASACHDLGALLGVRGRTAEALQPSLEAVRLRRMLIRDNPDNAERHRINLARSLANAGIRLSEAGRHAEALAATAESVLLRRLLTGGRELHISLLNFAQVRLTARMDLTNALKALDEAEEVLGTTHVDVDGMRAALLAASIR